MLRPTIKLDKEVLDRIDQLLELLKDKEIVITLRDKKDKK
jgi:hypothetical protein